MPTIGRSLLALALLATVAHADASAPSSSPSPSRGKRCAVRDRAGMIDALRLKCAQLDDETRVCHGARILMAALARCAGMELTMPRGERGPVDVFVVERGERWLAHFGARAAGGERTLEQLIEIPRD